MTQEAPQPSYLSLTWTRSKNLKISEQQLYELKADVSRMNPGVRHLAKPPLSHRIQIQNQRRKPEIKSELFLLHSKLTPPDLPQHLCV